MADKQIKENYLDFYLQNSDWEGRTVVDSFETISFQRIRQSASGIMSKTRTMIPIGITLLRLSCP